MQVSAATIGTIRRSILPSALLGLGLGLALLATAGAVLATRDTAIARVVVGVESGMVAPSSCVPIWQVVPSPNPGANGNTLYGVAVLTPNDVWSVGDGVSQPLTEHWNGSTWSTVPSPSVGTTANILYSVVALSPNNVWAVGAYDFDTGGFIEHWNGTQWSVIPSPSIAATQWGFRSVSGVATNDMWAVGVEITDTISPPLIEHWNGTAWSIVHTLDSIEGQLNGVEALSASDAWAVGYYTSANPSGTLTAHWNGTTWSVVSSPNVGTRVNELNSITAVSGSDVWAVGRFDNTGVNGYHTLAEHWNGSAWSIVSSPNASADNSLNGVTAVSTGDVWAVGVNQTGLQTLVEHWDGSSWGIVPSPNAGTSFSELLGAGAVGAGDVWAVGLYDAGGLNENLVEHYSSSCVLPTSTPAPTTPTPTPTPCSGFSDVPSGSTFYPFVTCLVSRSIVSGYPDCTFHVSSNVTRGQLSKIVSLAANFTDPPGNQIFQDVPPGSTFYNYAQRLANRSIIGGYACGGAGEPCVPPANRPYFRPNSNATRGQISKIVSNAAGFSDPPGAQIFQDIAPSSTFYNYIQRLANRSIIGGYACGVPGEPCVPPANRPYFRPNANATRGQVSKIVANAFFPNCQNITADK